MSVRVRFAPSPTGHVHIGNIRAAIFNWLFARHHGGRFLLRIEDTDRERSTPEAVQTVIDALEWLRLDWDEPPVYQSAQRDRHLAAAEELLRKQLAYREDKGQEGRGECIVFRMPKRDISFNDAVKGLLRKNAEDLKDFVIVRSDGTPVFHLANVVDDIAMGITHIIRGDDHVENTFRHIALFEALEAPAPRYAHLPMIVNAQGKPYSKRDGAAYVGEFREKGYWPEALLNYLALLGWSPGGDREKMSREEMISLFSLDRVKSSPAQMDLRKLTHLNSLYVAEMPLETFIRHMREYTRRHEWAQKADPTLFERVAGLLQTRTPVFSQTEAWEHFFRDDITYDEKAVRKTLGQPGMRRVLETARACLTESDFSVAGLEAAVRRAAAASNLEPGRLNQPLRVAVTGSATGAGIFETMAVLGREKTLTRLQKAATLCAE